MDSEQYAIDLHYIEAGSHWHVRHEAGELEAARNRDGDGWKLVEVFLSGGAPWGFTLRGGLEHREALLITKVEEASKAAAVGLQAGDELVNINEIPLSGFRQEAICLVKGSHKTLSLMVKRKNQVKGRNEPISRPHSWHSTKFNESQSESAKTQSSSPAAVWHATYDASSSSTDLSSGWEQTNLCRVSDQFSSLGSMDSLEHVPHPYPAGQLSAKSNNSMEHLGGGKRDSAYSSFSTSSGTPDFTLSKSNAASTENVLYKVSQWDAGGRHSNGRNSQSVMEGVKQEDRLVYLAGCDGPQTDDQAGSRHSTSGRTSYGPVWHVPEKKKSSSSSPPPPAPPARSDSFAATKERGLGAAHLEVPSSRVHGKSCVEDRGGQCLSMKNDKGGFYSPSQFSSNKQHSLSSSDVRQGQPTHHRHHSDKSTFPSQPWATTTPKNTSGYFSSMQELPTNSSLQTTSQNPVRNGSTSQAVDPNFDAGGHSHYYCVSASGKPEDRKGSAGLDSTQTGNEQDPQTLTKPKYQLSPQQQYSSNGRESNGYSKHHVTSVVETSPTKVTADDNRNHRGPNVQSEAAPYPSRHSEQRRSLPLQHREFPQDTRHHSQAGSKISPQTTPMLHSLSMDTKGESDGALESKQMMRSDRFATTLKSEIQMRRANLQKSKSAATLPGDTEDDQDVWKSNKSLGPGLADSPFTNTYKDNLKEAQARVLKATSFRRKDLEPVLVEHPSAEAIPNYQSSAMARKDLTPLPTVSETTASKSGTPGGPVMRIGGRKRFQAEKKVRSFSEPDKIHEVGVKEEESASFSLDQQKLFKENGKSLVPNHQSSHSEKPRDSVGPGFASEMVHMPKGIGGRDDPQGGPYSTTFAEYEARWNVQKKPPETRASGRFRSADNILDPGSEERAKSACFHERSRSSPSADIYGQMTCVAAITTPVKEQSPVGNKPTGSPNSASSFPEGRSSDCKETSAECERRPPPPKTGHRAAASSSPAVAVDHRPAEFSLSPAADPAKLACGARRKPPPPRCPEINPHDCTPSSDGSKAEGKEPVDHQPPASSSNRTPATMEVRRSPSPHFSPQRLSDKPPIYLQDQDSNGVENVRAKPSSAVKKVPVRMVRSEGMSDKECGGPDMSKLASLGGGGQDSVFLAFSRQRRADSMSSPQKNPKPPRDPDVIPVGEQSASKQPQPTAQSGVDDDVAAPRISEERKREELARDIMDKDKSLADILDQSKMKTTMDLMEGIFPQGELEGTHQRRKASSKATTTRPVEEREKEDSMAAAVAMVTSSAYYSTSAPKAELLIKMKDMQEQDEDEEDELDMDLASKKQELIDSLSKKLQVLREARESLQEDVLDNNALGDEVEARVQQVCKPNELDKFRMFVGDLDKVVSLLLSLSGRLARVENALNSLDEDATPEERRTLTEKRKLLIRQHEDAKELKENLDRRERVVYDILASYLPEEGMADYEHFVKMKSALIIEQRKLEDKIKLGEEQLKCLLDSLPIEQRLSF
ncbi:protein Shroom2 isoform X3 [Dunckerocampus dactyliophorus]|uniref:protein Shroom2 isoform X3 n=1 Tax=Dunckerocampus dactyliophorus TaxID=161453 RepID=UPI0024056693|nr:protein Shroom2 isoform X3 [Dunckerocampus dactyliophorus]